MMIGNTISHYRILQKIGSGGMGEVFLAEDTKLERKVALKFLPAQFSADEEERKRFIHEAKAASALDHANICSIYEIGETPEEQLFIAMGYYEGKTLKEKMKAGQLPVNEAVEISIQIAEGLKKAHGKGIVHRDLKPANIMLTDEGIVKIVDFGLAKLKGLTRLTKSGTTLGTVAYMSPEQALGKEVDQRSDIWSLGVILYEMLTGTLPFNGEYDQAVLYAVINEEPERLSKVRPDIPVGLEKVIGRALAKAPAKRYLAIADLLQDLKAIASSSMPSKSRPFKAGILGIRKIFFYSGLAIMAIILLGLNIGKVSGFFSGKAEGADIRSLAVLPLANLSGDPGQEYFSDGMTDALIAGLAQIKALKVISRTSIMQYKVIKKSLPQIAKELGVEGIVEGSVMRSGNRVRITAQLIDARQDRHLWANNYEREMTDVLALQSEVVRAIASEIRAQVTPSERERLKETRRVDPEAYQKYLLGRFYLNKTTAPAIEKSIEYFKKAIAGDPQNAAAYAGLADANMFMGQMAGQEWAKIAAKERKTIEKILEIDDNSAEGHTTLGNIKVTADWDWEGGEREYKRAIELSPSYAWAYLLYSQLLNTLGRHQEALAQVKRAQELDPLNPFIAMNVMSRLSFLGREDEALAENQKLLKLYPNDWFIHWELGFHYLNKRMYEEAVAEQEKAVALSEGSLECLPDLGYAYAKAGRKTEALKVLDRMREEARKRYVPSSLFVYLYAGLGETDRAFAMMEKAFQERDVRLAYFITDPFFPLRSDPRLGDLAQRMKIPMVGKK